jgi:hypothetical protein
MLAMPVARVAGCARLGVMIARERPQWRELAKAANIKLL